MGLRPAQGDENGFCLTTALHGSVALPFVIRPERTRISCYAAVDRAACAAFREAILRLPIIRNRFRNRCAVRSFPRCVLVRPGGAPGRRL
jgi:hypothetical protein